MEPLRPDALRMQQGLSAAARLTEEIPTDLGKTVRPNGRPAPVLLLLLLFLGRPFTPYSIDAAALLGLSAEPLISLAPSLRGPEAQPRQCLDFSYCSFVFSSARRGQATAAAAGKPLGWRPASCRPFLWPLRQVSGNAAGPVCCCGSRGAVASVHCRRRSLCSRPALIAGGRGGALLLGAMRVATPRAA
ncbi:hypothetical protein MTO96_015841 [Rhipicephalus appendiculatus]